MKSSQVSLLFNPVYHRREDVPNSNFIDLGLPSKLFPISFRYIKVGFDCFSDQFWRRVNTSFEPARNLFFKLLIKLNCSLASGCGHRLPIDENQSLPSIYSHNNKIRNKYEKRNGFSSHFYVDFNHGIVLRYPHNKRAAWWLHTKTALAKRTEEEFEMRSDIYVVDDDLRQDFVVPNGVTNNHKSAEDVIEDLDSEWGWFDDELLSPRPTYESDIDVQSRRATKKSFWGQGK